MNSGVTKTQIRRCRAKPSKGLQEKLLEAVADDGAEFPRSRREHLPANECLAQNATSVQTAKRQLDAAESDPLPAKRARLTRTDAQQFGVQKAEQTDKATIQQPEPRPPKGPYASFLKDLVDPVYPHPRPPSLHTFISEWLESVGSNRERRCRSASPQRSDDDPVPRQLTRSAPEIGYTRDADGFTVPPTPASTRSRTSRAGSRASRADSEDDSNRSSASSTGVRHRMYRENNLALNNVRVRPSATPLPAVVSSHVEETVRGKRNSPGLSSDELIQVVDQLDMLAEGCDEDDVAAFLSDTIFPNPKNDPAYGPATGLASNSSTLMAQHLVPANPEGPYRVTRPKPGLLYGYSGKPANQAFTQPQILAQTMLHPRITHYPVATSNGLRFPFFAIEFKAAGGTQGDLWVAVNQCAGASSACLNAVGQLNTLLRKHQNVVCIDNLSYCIAVDNKVAELYVSWKEDGLNYYLQRVDAFLLSRSEDFQNFRRQVRNILDWGKDARLKQIGKALDIILEENRKQARGGQKKADCKTPEHLSF